jgi:hypothetical protein
MALRPFLGEVTVKPSRVLAGQGPVECYALHRWREHPRPVGQMAEFVELESRRRILTEFTRLGDLEPTGFGKRIMGGAGRHYAHDLATKIMPLSCYRKITPVRMIIACIILRPISGVSRRGSSE